jgi:hypothetical protein
LARKGSSMKQRWRTGFCLAVLLMTALAAAAAADPAPAERPSASDLAQLIRRIRGKATILESSSGMRLGFESFTTAYRIPPNRVSYSDFVLVRLLYEATRDAGFWNLHWDITDQPPNSDRIWRQWQDARQPSWLAPTATAECDELSALYSFLVGRAGVKGVGLFWPTYNHTVAVWELHPAGIAAIRVVVPTSQIFLGMNDSFGTRKFNPWRQKTIHEYTRRDVADAFVIPRPLFDFFLSQVDKYAGASDSTLQQLRYLREGVFLKYWTAEDAARDALSRKNDLHAGSAEDLAAFWNFAQDMRSSSIAAGGK